MDADELTTNLGEVRRQLTSEVNLRRNVIKPIEQALRALKDPHGSAVALYEAGIALKQHPTDLELPRGSEKLFAQIQALANEKILELEFTFARDLRLAFKEKNIKLGGETNVLVADLFLIKPDMRGKQVEMTFSRQPVTAKKIKLDVAQVVNAYERARKDICERKVEYNELIKEMFEAYERVLKLSGKQLSARTSIVDCYRELVLVRQPFSFRKAPSKTSFKDYPKTHFAYDMLQLRQLNKLTYNSWRLNFGTATIDASGDTAKVMFLATGANEGQFIRDLYFTEK